MESESALKNLINENVIKKIAKDILKHYPSFDVKKFNALSAQINTLELKARVRLLAAELKELLPPDYSKALKILVKVMNEDHLSGFELWPFSEFIGQFGLDHFDESMEAMYVLTQRFTSEFAIRSFFIRDHKKVLDVFEKWARDKNVHVRRLVSEGSRPLLPWGERLILFVKDPMHTVPLLEILKNDDEIYVRKSVANHLNDISKHHPLLVIKLLRRWEMDCEGIHQDKITWIKRHALRTLIKKGHPEAMTFMGVDIKPKIKLQRFSLKQKKLTMGDKFSFNLVIESTSPRKQKLLIDYVIHFMKSNKTHGHKVFKLTAIEIEGKENIKIEKIHHLKKITTMKFYSGIQYLSIQINGEILKKVSFKLEV